MCAFSVNIDEDSGFCFGVVNAIKKAETELQSGFLYCLGDIVHNSAEVERLRKCGLRVIMHDELENLHNARLLLRAHGEPPSTYQTAKKNNVHIVDATCPVVLRLQQRIRAAYQQHPEVQIVIYGKLGHAEVNGLVGQTDGNAIVVESEADLDLINPERPVMLFSQTTKSLLGFEQITQQIKQRCAKDVQAFDTICRQVAGRMDKIKAFASRYDAVLFVGGVKSSNAKVLFEAARSVNEHTWFVSSPADVPTHLVQTYHCWGVCGATSTPRWQMEEIKNELINRRQLCTN